MHASATPSPSCTGVILAGGANTRFGGRAKGALEVGGRRMVDRVLDALRTATSRQLLVVKEKRVGDELALDIPTAVDLTPKHASLVGVSSALGAAGSAVLIVAWDMPFVSAALLRAIRTLGERHGAAAIAEGPHGLEPLCAYYPSSALDVAMEQLGRGELRLHAFIAALHHIVVSVTDVATFGDPRSMFMNVNSPADLAAAERIVTNEALATPAPDLVGVTSPTERR